MKLEPCPFCGSDNAMMLGPTCRPETPYNPADRLFPIVRCGSCCAEVSGSNEDYRGKSAIEAWNRRAYLAATKPPLADVTVKALEWTKYPNKYAPDAFPGPFWDASTPFGRYNIDRQEQDPEIGAPITGEYWFVLTFSAQPCGTRGSLDEAQAAAQADYEQRIQSALASPPMPGRGEEWSFDLTTVPRDRDFLIQYDHGEVTVGHYLDNSKTRWPFEGVRPCRSMRPERAGGKGEKIVAWRDFPAAASRPKEDTHAK